VIISGGRKKVLYGPILLTILYALILSGCVLTQPTESLSPVSVAEATRITAPAPSQPIPAKEEAVTEALTLERSLDIASKNNPEVAATLWDVSAAGAKVDQAKASRWPWLGYEGNYTKNLNSRPLFEARYNNQRRLFTKQYSQGSVILKLPLFTGGRIINEIKAAELFRLAEENRLSRTGDELVYNVSSTFYAILSQEKVIDSVKFSLQAMQE